jgi:predicted amidohydrolase
MKIAIAQISPVKGDIPANIAAHKKWIDLAILHKADLIFFPELSVTGYEPELANILATSETEERFDDFQDICDKSNITIGLGMPTRTLSGVSISMLIFQAQTPGQIYSKQFLHPDELPYFVSGDKQLILTVGNKKIAPAICYESLQTYHAEHAVKLGAEIYMASVAKSQQGVDKAMRHYPDIAKKFSMPVLMSNCLGPCDNFDSVGKSAVWTKQGKLAGQLNEKREGMLIFDTETEEVMEQTIFTVSR